MATVEERITELEIQLAHQNKVIDELNDIVARQDKEMSALTRKVQLLLESAADMQTAGQGVVLADQKPPHW